MEYVNIKENWRQIVAGLLICLGIGGLMFGAGYYVADKQCQAADYNKQFNDWYQNESVRKWEGDYDAGQNDRNETE